MLCSTTTVLHETFEGDYLAGWTNRTDAGANPSTRWGLNTVRASAGRQSAFAAALRGGVSAASGYRDGQHNTLVREDVSLAGLATATLAFDYFLDTESGYDTMSVAVTDAAGARTTLFSESGDHAAAGWRRKTIDLGAFAGRRDLDLEFRFVSDSSVTNPGGGAWLDELRLTGGTTAPTGSLRGRLFDDANGNRTRDAGEKSLTGWLVYLDHNRNGARDAGEPSRTTGADGAYAFTGLPPGTYHVAEVVPAGYTQTSPGRAGAEGGSAFDIDVAFPDPTLTTSQRAAFTAAAAKWARVIVGDLPDVSDNGRAIDDLRITASAPSIDGRGGVLGRAAPTAFRDGSGLPYAGFMEFDAADLARLEADGQLTRVILHEMGHVLGFGTLWATRDLLRGGGGADPRYVGPAATRQYNAVFNNTAGSVPVESTGGPGTADSHWRDSTFASELMTGYLDGGRNALSRVTVGAMADLGYAVSYAAADPYGRPGSAATSTSRAAAADGALLPFAHTVYVGAGTDHAGVDFGNRRTGGGGSIAGLVFDDRNGNGARDAGEPGQAGWRVYLDANRNQRFDAGERNVVTPSGGAYRFAGLPAGTYAVREVDQAGWTRPRGSPVVALAARASVTNAHIANFRGASIAGRVYHDADRNGVADSGGAGVAGIRVYDDANPNRRLDAGERGTTTDPAGNYVMNRLATAARTVRIVPPAESVPTAASAGICRLTPASGQAATGRDFGSVTAALARALVHHLGGPIAPVERVVR